MLKPVASNPAVKALNEEVSRARLQKACKELESIFITHMLKSMRATVDEGGLIEDSNASQIIKSMFDENLARGIAQGGGIGLAKILFESLKDQQSV